MHILVELNQIFIFNDQIIALHFEAKIFFNIYSSVYEMLVVLKMNLKLYL